MNKGKSSIAINILVDYGLDINLTQGALHFMQFGFFKYFILMVFLILLAGFGWLALMDLPVAQQEIIVNVPIAGAQ